ncbi:MAG TPA: right-handed parallel beta-helix repeat-containing protein, partial [Kiritimatiellia bacterium]|nr:right-handed parallel beta-helix repeat-containing protein [Kiritimatiellia bacterium]
MQVRKTLAIALTLAGAFMGSSNAATRYVNVSNAASAAPYTNWSMAATAIQPAIDAAVSGDEILVAPGMYYLPGSEVYIPPEKTLTLRGIHSREAIINALYQSPGLRVAGTNSLVEGFTIRSGQLATLGYGGGIHIGRTATVRDCLVTGNWAAGGAGIFVASEATNSLVEDCTIEGNTATNGAGGGIALYENSRGRVNRCIIRDNGADYGGGVWITKGGSVSNCRIIGNRAALTHGGGVYMHASGTTNPATLVNSVIF